MIQKGVDQSTPFLLLTLLVNSYRSQFTVGLRLHPAPRLKCGLGLEVPSGLNLEHPFQSRVLGLEVPSEQNLES
jgi:hypothetical protein